MNIKAFKIKDSEPFKLGESLDSVMNKLRKAVSIINYWQEYDNNKLNTNIIINDTNEFTWEDETSIILVFNTEKVLVGFIQPKIDPLNDNILNITFITEEDKELDLDIKQFVSSFTPNITNLYNKLIIEKHKSNYKESNILYGKDIDINGFKCVAQVLDYNYWYENLVFIIKDYINIVPLLGNETNLTKLAEIY